MLTHQDLDYVKKIFEFGNIKMYGHKIAKGVYEISYYNAGNLTNEKTVFSIKDVRKAVTRMESVCK